MLNVDGIIKNIEQTFSIGEEQVESYHLLHCLKNCLSVNSYLEIGVNEGYSLVAMLVTDPKILSLHPPSDVLKTNDFVGKVIDVELALCDTWGDQYGGKGTGNGDHIKRILQHLGLSDARISILNGDSKELIPQLNRRFDVIYVDGDHSYNGAMADLINVANLFNNVIVFDDIYHPGHPWLEKCLDDFCSNMNFMSTKFGQKVGVGAAIIYRP